MKVTRSVGYALAAIGEVNKCDSDGPVLSNKISERYNIPLEYLLKIMQQLTRTNILRSKRGPKGGFVMARPMSKISLLEVIETIDGPMKGIFDFSDAKKSKFTINAQKAFTQAEDKSKSMLKSTALSSLV